jgi:hypothetical protein
VFDTTKRVESIIPSRKELVEKLEGKLDNKMEKKRGKEEN